MGKLKPLHQILEVDGIVFDTQVAGTVLKSNFVDKGTHHLFPIHPGLCKFLSSGDKLKITNFADKDKIEELENDGIKFNTLGLRYEIWNSEKGGWEKVFEEFVPQDES